MLELKQYQKAFKALGQATRLKIMLLLAQQELCVCELEDILGITAPAVSQHLNIMKEADLVTERRCGQWVFYALNKEHIGAIFDQFAQALDTPISQIAEMQLEHQRLEYLKQHPKPDCRNAQ